MIQLKDLVKAGVHFGHRTARWSPSMRSYIWGARGGIHLIDVSKTAFLMEHAAKQLEGFAAEGKSILWVGTKRPARETIAKAGERTNCPVVVNRWVGGALTNFDQIKKAITRLLHLKDVISKPLEHYTKKELCVIQKEVDRLDKKVGGIVNLKFPPAAIVVVDAKKEATAVREASYLGIPVIGLVDTNTDPKGVSVVIPANDDSPRSISLVINYLVDAVERGRKDFEIKKAEQAAKKAAEKLEEKAKAKTAGAKAAAGKPAPHQQKPKDNRPPVKKTDEARPAAKPAPKKPEVKSADKKAEPAKATEKKETPKPADKKVEEKPVEKKKDAPVKGEVKPAASKAPTVEKTETKKTAEQPKKPVVKSADKKAEPAKATEKKETPKPAAKKEEKKTTDKK